MTQSDLVAPETPRGFVDRRGAEAAAEEAVVARVGAVYERWGFERLDTSAFEYSDVLGKHLPDEDRPNAGVFSLQDDDERWMSLRYDLTAPLARFAAENWTTLAKPYRRWQAGQVWRNEKPGPGRYRQFLQCDADTVGAGGPAADAEMVAMAAEALNAVGLTDGGFEMKISTRRILNGLLETIGLTGDDVERARLTVSRAVDKLDRLGPEGVEQLLGKGRKDESGDFTAGAGLDRAAVGKIMSFVRSERGGRADTLARLTPLVGDSAEGRAGLDELAAIDDVLSALGVGDDKARFDPSIVRGLEYYTGAVFEADLTLPSPEGGEPVRMGSVGGGGRYDDLVARFTGERVPATGFSVGVSRLTAALKALGRERGDDAIGPVVVLALDRDQMADYFAVAAAIRAAGLAAEVYLGASGMRAQMKYADRRKAPLAVIIGEDERARGVATLKDLRLGAKVAAEITDHEQWRKDNPAQFEAPRDGLVDAVVNAVRSGAP